MSDLEHAISLRKQDKAAEALEILKTLLAGQPDDPTINYQIAWTCDSLGNETEAAPYYEKAIVKGLAGEDLLGAYLGLGSTYRCLGRYYASLDIFEKAILEFPEDRSLKTFRALTLYNLGRFSDSVEELLLQLLDTTEDEGIKSFDSALRFYADKLDDTWK